MPRSGRHWKSMREETEEHLLRCGLFLFSRDGYGATSVRAIAREAQVSLGLLYRYFDGKEALFQALYRQNRKAAQDALAHVASWEGNVIRALFFVGVGVVRENAPFWRLLYGLRFQPGIRSELGLMSMQEPIISIEELTRILAVRGIAQPQIRARVISALLDGICQNFSLDPEYYPTVDVVDAALTLCSQWSGEKQPGS